MNEEVKKYNKAFINFMKPSEEETGGEESIFRMPALPLLTLNGIKKSASDNELKTPTDVDKPQEKNYEQ